MRVDDRTICWYCGRHKAHADAVAQRVFERGTPFLVPVCSRRCESLADDVLTFRWYSKAIREQGSAALLNGDRTRAGSTG